jgi:predicted amidohydrolase
LRALARKLICPSISILASCGNCLKQDANGIDADDILPQVVELLPGDVLAHPLPAIPVALWTRTAVYIQSSAALARGLWVDVGHGSHFSFKMARIALDAGIVPHTLGADMHGYNTHVPGPAARQTRIRTKNTCSLVRYASAWFPP